MKQLLQKLQTIDWASAWANMLLLSSISTAIAQAKTYLNELLAQDPDGEFAVFQHIYTKYINFIHTLSPQEQEDILAISQQQLNTVQAGLSITNAALIAAWSYFAYLYFKNEFTEHLKDKAKKQAYKVSNFVFNPIKSFGVMILLCIWACAIAYNTPIKHLRDRTPRIDDDAPTIEIPEWWDNEPSHWRGNNPDNGKESNDDEWKNESVDVWNSDDQSTESSWAHIYDPNYEAPTLPPKQQIDKRISLKQQHPELLEIMEDIEDEFSGLLTSLHILNAHNNNQEILFYDNNSTQEPLLKCSITYTNKTFIMSEDESTREVGELRDKITYTVYLRVYDAEAHAYTYVKFQAWSSAELASIWQTHLNDPTKRDMLHKILDAIVWSREIHDDQKIDWIEDLQWKKPNPTYKIIKVPCEGWMPSAIRFEAKN